MFQSPELTLCHKTERVLVHKIPPLSTTKGYYLDDWSQRIWEGGVKVTEKQKAVTIAFIDQQNKVFAQTTIKPNQNYRDCIVKTLDSSRGYAVRLQKPNGGYLWIGVAFRDRNDAFDFGVALQDHAQRKKLASDPSALNKQFQQKIDFSLKKGEKIKINLDKKKQKNSNADYFSDFNLDAPEEKKPKIQSQTKGNNEDWFGDFGAKKQTKKESNDFNLLDL